MFESHIRCLPARPKKALEVRWRTAIAAAGLSVAGKEDARTASAMATAEGTERYRRKIARAGLSGYRTDARLALAEIEMKEGQTAAGRPHLAAVELDAKAKGYLLITRKAVRVHG